MRRGGFTLVEVVVASAVGALVAASSLLALHAVFAGWTRLAAGGTLLQADRALWRLERDVAGARPLPGAPFVGSSGSLRFPQERGGALVVVEWTAAPGALRRAERPYRFDDEASFDGRDAGGRAIQPRIERYRLPGTPSFSFPESAGGSAAAEPATEWTAAVPTNLPRLVRATLPGIASRDMPCRLAAP